MYLPMRKFLSLIILLSFFTLKNYAQIKSGSADNAADSAEIMKDLEAMLSGGENAAGYFSFSMAIGNRNFNVRNNALNSKLTPVNTIILSPSAVYHHKSGLYISAGGNLLNDNQKGFGFNQYSISPGYELAENKNVEFGFVYTHYFVKDNFSPYSSPVQNDFYVSLAYKKTWLKPGLAIGYSTGAYGDVRRNARFYDSITNKIKSFSLVPSLSHDFVWNNIFTKNDGIFFTTSLMMSAGETQTAIHHNTNATTLANFLNKKGRLPKLDRTRFEPQSIGLSLDASYVINNFTFEPQAYFDCYLPATTDKRFSGYFTLTLNYTLQ
jgi:hypothetical protein